MAKGKQSQLIGTAGTYYVMAQLAGRGYHASCTFGNAPCVDILVATEDGRRTLSIQVKTARCAQRWKAGKLVQLQWTLGHKAVRQGNPRLVCAFVDLKNLSSSEVPDVYIIPSEWIRDEYGGEWVDSSKWVRFHVQPETIERFKNNWDSIAAMLE